MAEAKPGPADLRSFMAPIKSRKLSALEAGRLDKCWAFAFATANIPMAVADHPAVRDAIAGTSSLSYDLPHRTAMTSHIGKLYDDLFKKVCLHSCAQLVATLHSMRVCSGQEGRGRGEFDRF